MSYLRLGALFLLAGLLAFGLSCSDDSTGGNKDSTVQPDKGADLWPTPDKGNPDTMPKDFAWPDQTKDQWPTPPDTGSSDYSGTPYGCEIDADCFGLKCCPTPWGVKVCSDKCAP